MKKNNFTFALLLPCLLFSAFLSAQKEGKFTLIVYTPDAFVKMDTQPTEKMSQQLKTYSLTEGIHQFQIWALGCELTKDTVSITANGSSQRAFNLKRTAAFVQYRKEMGNTALEKAMDVGSKIFIIGGNLGLTWFVTLQGRSKVNDQLALMKANKSYYENSYSLAELPKLKADFETSKTDYQNSVKYYNTKLLVGIPLTLLAYYGSYRLFKKMNKNKKKTPDFKDQNPLSNREYQLNPIYDMSATGNVGLNLNIKF
jgi:hypothetical protein